MATYRSAPGTGAVVPPAGITPTARERKYDRQLRLWAAPGQKALESSRVLFINTVVPHDGVDGQTYPPGVAGVEALKNLVLPGVGGFTIVDHATVEEKDLGVNFFLEEQSLGKNRGAETCRLLRELNPDVDGDWTEKPLPTLLADPSFISSFSLILLTAPAPMHILSQISSAASDLNLPLIYIHSVGFYGSFSVQLPSIYPILETHPPPDAIQDLRLTNPWPELAAEAGKLRTGEGGLGAPLDELDDYEHGHVPWLLLLLYYIEIWKEERGNGLPPQNYKEKTEFREMVRLAARTHTPEGGEENFDEACAAVLKYVSLYSLPDTIQEIFDLAETKDLTPETPNFFLIAHALAQSVQLNGVLPLPGVLPDMKAKSQEYVRLQRLYKEKAVRDAEVVENLVKDLESQLDRPSTVSRVEIDAFCKGASSVRLIRGRRIPMFADKVSTEARTEAVMAMRTKDQNIQHQPISDATNPSSPNTHCHSLSDATDLEDAVEAKRVKMDTGRLTPANALLDSVANLKTSSPSRMSPARYSDGGAVAETVDDTTKSSVVLDLALEGETYSSVVPIWVALKTLDGVISYDYRQRTCAPPASHVPENLHSTILNQIYWDLGLDESDQGGELHNRCTKALEEVERAGGGELHNIAALIGGMVAQEVLKVLTRQYVPVNNTVIFDGVSGKSGMLRL